MVYGVSWTARTEDLHFGLKYYIIRSKMLHEKIVGNEATKFNNVDPIITMLKDGKSRTHLPPPDSTLQQELMRNVNQEGNNYINVEAAIETGINYIEFVKKIAEGEGKFSRAAGRAVQGKIETTKILLAEQGKHHEADAILSVAYFSRAIEMGIYSGKGFALVQTQDREAHVARSYGGEYSGTVTHKSEVMDGMDYFNSGLVLLARLIAKPGALLESRRLLALK